MGCEQSAKLEKGAQDLPTRFTSPLYRVGPEGQYWG